MNEKTFAIVAAAFFVGLFVTVDPDFALDSAGVKVEDSSLTLPISVAVDRFAAMWAPIAATGQKAVQGHRRIGERDGKIVPTQDWPFCDPACLKARQNDRLLQESVVEKNRTLSPSTGPSPAPTNRAPFGCDPVFSPITDPAHARIHKRCMA